MKNIDKKNLGIMTFFNVNNYGAVLQAFALQTILGKYGCNTEFLNYSEMKETKEEKKKSVLGYIKTLFKLRFDILTFLKTEKPRHSVSKMFETFRKDYLSIGNQKLYELEDLKEYVHKYDGVIAGSDMVWTDIGQDLDAYFLKFVDYNKRISYAPSITGTKFLNEGQNKKMKEYILGIKYLSCREKEGIDYVKKITNRDASLVVDPTLLLSKQEWEKELNIKKENKTESKKYILCYMFQGVPNKIKKQLKKIAKNKNMDIRYVPMSIWEYDHELKLGKTGAYGPREFVELFLNASFVVTNSFHGLLFSIISNIPFVVFHRDKNCKWQANEERMKSILKIIKEENRFLSLNDKITNSFFKSKDYSINLEKEIEISKTYLTNTISSIKKSASKKEKINNVNEISVKKCTGCSACKNVCPKQCIEMKEDVEGFLFPRVDKNKCINCGLCVNVCPSLNDIKDRNTPKLSKIGFSKDIEKIGSASGGIFYTIGKYFIENLKGVVYGVILDENMQCVHKVATNIQELQLMQNSKYIQSKIENCYMEAKKYLEKGKYVLFSGTPCQIAGLKMLLKKDYSNLLTIDLICHGVPNQLFWDLNLKNEVHNDKIEELVFRNKDKIKEKRSAYEMKYKRKGEIKKVNYNENPYYNSFICGDSFRKSCYYCKYSNINRVGDITIGDCDSWRNYPDFYKDEVKSTILINSDKGYIYWQKLLDYFVTAELNLDEEMKVNVPLSHSTYKPSRREEIYKDLINLNWKDFNKKYTSKQSKIVSIKKTILKVLRKR